MFSGFKNCIINIFIIINVLALSASAKDKFDYRVTTDQNEISVESTDTGVRYNLKDDFFIEIEGAPEIPYKIIRLALPENTKISSISATGSNISRLAQGIEYAWFEGDIKTGTIEKFKPALKNQDIYMSNKTFPGKYAELINEGMMGPQHLTAIAVYPLQFNPVKGEMFLIGEINIHIDLIDHFTNLTGSLPKAANQVRNMLDNPADFQTPIIGSFFKGDDGIPGEFTLGIGAEYLIITSAEIAPAFYPYAVWKNQKGLLTELVLIEEILQNYSGEDQPARLRAYLQEAYNNGAMWVLLGGDEDVIPIRYAYHGNVISTPPLSNQQICDLYYSDLTGNWDYDGDGVYGEPNHDQPDIYPELYVGRVPVVSLEEAETWVEKALLYEQNPGNGDFSYLTKGLIIVADQMRDLNEHVSLAGLMPDNFLVDISSCAEEPSGGSQNPTQPTAEMVIEVLNEGWGFTSNLNHGSPYHYTTMAPGYNIPPRSFLFGDFIPDGDGSCALALLDESDKYSIHYSISCENAAFDFDKEILRPGPFLSENTLMESFLLLPHRAGVGYLGNTRWGWVLASFRMEGKFIEYVFSDSASHLAIAEALSKIYYSSYRDITYGHNLFGDPEMEIWTKTPVPLTINAPNQIDINCNSITASVSTPNGPATDVMVCAWKPGELYYRGTTDADGEIEIPFVLAYGGQMYLTADAKDMVPDVDTINVSNQSNTDDKNIIPGEIYLGKNYPNPFNYCTEIRFATGEPSHIKIDILDIAGRKVTTLADNTYPSGNHLIKWDGNNSSGKQVASGTYLYRLKTENKEIIKKMLLLK